MKIFLHWILAALAVIVAAYLLKGITITGFLVALVVALVLGFLNTFIKPLLVLLSLPLEIKRNSSRFSCRWILVGASV